MALGIAARMQRRSEVECGIVECAQISFPRVDEGHDGIHPVQPQDFFRDQVRRQGHVIADDVQVCVGQIFLPRTDLGAQERARSIIETEVVHFGFYIYGWRQPPIDTSVIGMKANATRPEIEQILFTDRLGRDQQELERTLYVCRRRIEKRAREAGMAELYVCSFSSRALIYKGMFLAADIDAFYLDLKATLSEAPKLDGYPVRLVDDHTLEVQVDKSKGINGLFAQLNAQGLEVLSLRNKSNRLEELFVSLVEKNLSKVAV